MNAALYLRVSTEAQVEKFSLPAQRRILADYCKAQGWEPMWYEDAGISGETIEARPQMKRLLADAKARKFQVALAVEFSRFSRSQDVEDLGRIKRTFREAGIKWGIPGQLLDMDDATQSFLATLLGAVSGLDKQTILRNTKRGREEAARKGKFVGRVWYGVRKRADGTLEVINQEAEVARFIWETADRARSLRAVVKELSERGMRMRSGKPWTRSRIQKMLKNPAYCGRYLYGRSVTTHEGTKRIVRQRTDGGAIEIRVPAIVSRELFERVQARLVENKRLSARRGKRFFLLRGLVTCAVCGYTMIGKSSSHGDRSRPGYYTCAQWGETGHCKGHAINAATLEEHIWREVTESLTNPDAVIAEARKAREETFSRRDELRARLEYVKAALGKVPGERERVQSMYREGYASKDELAQQIDAIVAKTAKLTEERRSLESRLSEQTADEAMQARLEDAVARFCISQRKALTLRAMSDEQRFELVHTMIERVQVHPAEREARRAHGRLLFGPQVDVRLYVRRSKDDHFVTLTS